MANIDIKPDWHLPERIAAPEHTFLNRRQLIKTMGIATAGTIGAAAGMGAPGLAAWGATSLNDTFERLPNLQFKANPAYRLDVPPTRESIAAQYNNFYEFSTGKDDVWRLAAKLKTRPWAVKVSGLVRKPQTLDIDDLLRTMPLEERVYRFRCVEAWSMVVPWIGFPMKALLDRVEPTSQAKYVVMNTFYRPEEAPRQNKRFFFREPWPYQEGLTMQEAMNDLTLLTVGSYGHILPKQHGAPIRLITPWKYGYKSIKSIVSIELAAEKPTTFWNSIAPHEYGFFSNVNPRVPHPRWSQARERNIGTRERQPTLLYNGYAEQVAHMYKPV